MTDPYETIESIAVRIRLMGSESPSYNVARELGKLADELDQARRKAEREARLDAVWARDAIDLLKEIDGSCGMTNDQRRAANAIFRSHLMESCRQAEQTVLGWPEWKQELSKDPKDKKEKSTEVVGQLAYLGGEEPEPPPPGMVWAIVAVPVEQARRLPLYGDVIIAPQKKDDA